MAPETTTQESETILRLTAVIEKTGLSRSSIYKAINQKTFPTPLPLTGRSVGWLLSEIDQWIEAKVVERQRLIDEKNAPWR